MNEKRFIKPLSEKLKRLTISFETDLADAQHNSAKVRKTVEEYGAEPVMPYRKTLQNQERLEDTI